MNVARTPMALIMAAAMTVLSLMTAGSATAAEPAMIEFSTSLTVEQTVTVTETATVGAFTGTGKATATASATASGSAREATNWEAYYWAVTRAQAKATADARAAAEAIARPIAKQRAEDDARAKAAAAPVLVEFSTSLTVEQTVTVTETATVGAFTGTGKATATASATATGSAREATNWEAYYWAVTRAQAKATADARAAAEAIARPIAKQRAEDDARAKAAAAPVLIEWSTTATRTETVTVTETATVDGFEGYGTATASATVTATGSAKAATNWEVYYYATVDAQTKARNQAKAQADAEARALAKQRALADAQSQADAAAADPGPGEDPGGSGGTPSTPAGSACGAQVLKSDGTPWVCTFVDGFSGSELDTTKWAAVETSTSRFSYGDCFLGLGPNIAVADGKLSLTTRHEDEPVVCQHPDGPIETPYTSASVTSLGTFSQTFGRFEIRAAMPATNGPGIHSALWLVPDEPSFYGGWPNSGEIDVAEFFSANPDRVIPTLHYDSLVPFNLRTNNQCLVFDPTQFHTYAVEWTAKRITMTVDGTTCLDHAISPVAPLLGAAPFDRAFNVNLTQALGSGKNVLPEGASFDEATMSVDYVRVWS